MKIQEAIGRIETYLYVGKSRGTQPNPEVISRLTTAKGVLEAIKASSSEQGDLVVPKSLAILFRGKSSITVKRAEDIDRAASQWRADRDNAYGEKHEESQGVIRRFCRLDFWLPLLVSIVTLALGLVLGCTVFAQKQDTLYFVLESIKDMIGCVVSGLLTKEIANRTIQKNSQMKIGESRRDVIVIGFLTVFEVAALVFSIFLLLGAKLAIFERFSHWSKFTYFWMSISVALISVICTVTLVMRLFKSRKADEGRDSV